LLMATGAAVFVVLAWRDEGLSAAPAEGHS